MSRPKPIFIDETIPDGRTLMVDKNTAYLKMEASWGIFPVDKGGSLRKFIILVIDMYF
jgi:hypothetical protein